VWVSGYGLSVLSLYTWSTPLHLLNQRVAYSLKGSGPEEIYFDAAISLGGLRLSLGAPLLNPVFIPSPRSGRLFARDHAENFCKALATVMGGQEVHALKRRSQSVHRRKTRAERELAAESRFELKNEKNMQNLQHHQGTIIFVDDLITTGSTARAAWLLLGRPQQFEVWTLLNKPSGSC
jgi:hypothetical protein